MFFSIPLDDAYSSSLFQLTYSHSCNQITGIQITGIQVSAKFCISDYSMFRCQFGECVMNRHL